MEEGGIKLSQEEKINQLTEMVEGLRGLLAKIISPDGKIDLNMTIEQMNVQVTNQNRITKEVSTANLEGKILFCALSSKDGDFNRQPFSLTPMLNALLEHGWSTSKSSVNNSLLSLAKQALLIKEKDTYRLPKQVIFIGEGI